LRIAEFLRDEEPPRCVAVPLQPWKIVRSEQVYTSPPYLGVYSHTVELPDGRLIEPYYRIELRSFVVTAALTPDEEIVIGRQYRHGIGRVSLMLPGGLLETDEDPLVAARRELLEETGYVSDQWESLGRFVPNSNYRCGEAFLFLARASRRVAEPDSGDLEETELLTMRIADLVDAMRAGNVVSLSSAAAIALVDARLRA
jgi:ADP-ribose pyrophosphatase